MAGLSLSEFFSAFLDPDPNEDWPEEYLTFINDLYRSFDAELFDSREQLYEETKRLFSENGNKVGEPARINVQYGARMIYMEISWIEIVLMRILDKFSSGEVTAEEHDTAKMLISLALKERINIREDVDETALVADRDVFAWRQQMFSSSLQDYQIPAKEVRFYQDDAQREVIERFRQRFHNLRDEEFFYNAQDFIVPRSMMLYNLSFEET